jgi:hypothetical protein
VNLKATVQAIHGDCRPRRREPKAVSLSLIRERFRLSYHVVAAIGVAGNANAGNANPTVIRHMSRMRLTGNVSAGGLETRACQVGNDITEHDSVAIRASRHHPQAI